MTNRLIEINSEIEMLRELAKVEKTKLLGNLESVIYTKIIVPCCANLIKADIRMGWRGKPEITFHLGFWNAEENRIDFASDVDFYYGDEYKNLTINHGCTGHYDITNFYLVKRARMLNYVFDHYTEIEDALDDILGNKSEKYFEFESKISELSYEKSYIEKTLLDEKKGAIEKSIIVGLRVSYGVTVPIRDHIFEGDRTSNSYTWTVTKVTPKFVTLCHEYQGECKVRKDALVNEMARDRILVI